MNDIDTTPEPADSANRTSALAAASFVFGLMLAIGCVPGIICGHLAKAEIRRDSSLRGRRMATIGLALSYLTLIVCAGLMVNALAAENPGPKIVLRESPDAIAALQPRIVDEVTTGPTGSESAHKLRGALMTTGPFRGRSWRGADRGGYLEMTMKVLPDKPMILNVTYWGSEEGPRKFDIIVANYIIATQVLEYDVPGHFFDIEYKIPEEITHGKTEVVVEFRGHPGAATGGFFGFAILKQ